MTEIVLPTIAEFEANPTSRRHAFLACVVTFHAIDYLTSPKKPKALRDKLRRASHAFSVVDRVAHAFKHVQAGSPKAPYNQPLRAREVLSRPPGFAGVMAAGLSRVGDTVGGVTLATEREIHLLAIVREAADFLRRQGISR